MSDSSWVDLERDEVGRWLSTARRQLLFNRAMAAMLLGMTWWGLFH